MLTWFNNIFAATPDALRQWRWPILLVFLSITALMGFGLFKQLNIDMTLESWFQKDDPTMISLDQFKREFGSDDGLYIVYQPKDKDVFSYQSLQLITELVEELQNPLRVSGLDKTTALTRIKKVTALTNARYQLAQGDTLVARKLITGSAPQSASDRETLRQIALSQEDFIGAYVSRDFLFGGIQIKTDFGVVPVGLKEAFATDASKQSQSSVDEFQLDDTFELQIAQDTFDSELNSTLNADIEFEKMEITEYLAFMKDIRLVLGQEKYRQQFTFYPVGNPSMMDFVVKSMEQGAYLILIMLLIIIALLWSLLRSFSAVVWSVMIIVGSAFWTIGGVAWLGIEVSTLISLTGMLIVTVGVADSVHVFSSYIFNRRQGIPHQQAMTNTYRKTGIPILITSLTTMSGMLALTITGLPQFVTFGVMSAIGVGMAWLFTWLVLPGCMDLWHPYNDRKDVTEGGKLSWFLSVVWLQPLLDKIPQFVAARPYPIMGFFVVLFLIFAYGTSQVRVDTNIVELTKKGSTFRIAYEIVDEKMMGVQNMEIMLDLGVDDALKDPAVLKAISKFEQRLREGYPEFVTKTFSLSRILKDTNRVMHGGAQSYYTVPDDRQLTEQLMYLFSVANPEDRLLLVNDAFSKTHITVQLRNRGSYEYTDFFNAATDDLQRIFAPLQKQYPAMQLNITGNLALIMSLTQKMSESQFRSFSFAIIIISFMMILTLGSIQGGLISILPNMLPAVFTFGMMGLLGVPLDTDTMIIAPLIIGIAVDDTIHFITHYRDAIRASGDLDTAMRNTLKEVGQAVTFTSLVLGIGFFVLSFSDYGGMSKMGTFGSMAIFVALICDLLFLPALIYVFKPKFGSTPAVINNTATEKA